MSEYKFSSNLKLKKFILEAGIRNEDIVSIVSDGSFGYVITLVDRWVPHG